MGGIVAMPENGGISIIVPAYGEPVWVKRALESLILAQSRYSSRSEIIVSDGSEDPDASSIKTLAEMANAVYVHGERGASRQRNRGARAATLPILLFMDSGCEAAPDLLEAVARALSDPALVAVAGCVEFTGRRNLVFRSISTTRAMDALKGFCGTHGTVAWGVTANLAVRRDSFERVGGFDETFPPDSGGEDVDLALRIGSGAPVIAYRSEAIVRHPTEPWNRLGRLIRRLLSDGRADVYLLVRHPSLAVRDGPNLLSGFCLFAIASLWQALHHGTALWLAIPFLWTVLALLLFAFLTPGGVAPRLERSLGLLLLECVAAGRMWEAMRQSQWRFLWRRVQLEDAQTARDWTAIHRTWIATVWAAIGCDILVWLLRR